MYFIDLSHGLRLTYGLILHKKQYEKNYINMY